MSTLHAEDHSSAKAGLEPEGMLERGDIETHTDTLHRQDCWCSREGEALVMARAGSIARVGRPVEPTQVQDTEGISSEPCYSKQWPFVQFRRQRRFLGDNSLIELWQ